MRTAIRAALEAAAERQAELPWVRKRLRHVLDRSDAGKPRAYAWRGKGRGWVQVR